jgi:hypothetical protein
MNGMECGRRSGKHIESEYCEKAEKLFVFSKII